MSKGMFEPIYLCMDVVGSWHDNFVLISKQATEGVRECGYRIPFPILHKVQVALGLIQLLSSVLNDRG